MRILVTGGGSLLGQGIIKALRNIDKKFHLIAVDVNPFSAGLYWANEKYNSTCKFSKLLRKYKKTIT